MSIPVYHIVPPYHEFRADLRARPQRGTIQALEVLPRKLNVDELCRTAFALRRTEPALPLILWAPNAGVDALPLLAALMSESAIRAAVIGRSTEFLREQLTSDIALAAGITRWIVDAANITDRRVTADLHGLLRQATRHSTAGLSVKLLGAVERTWRARFKSARLPSPGRWVHMVRCLLPALALQRDVHRPVDDVAAEFGTYDASRLATRLRATFHHGPTGIRQMLGFEPLLDAWLNGDRGPEPVPQSLNRQQVAGIRSTRVEAPAAF